MVEITKPAPESFEIFDLTVDRFNRTVGQTGGIYVSITHFLNHDERVYDGIFVFFNSPANVLNIS